MLYVFALCCDCVVSSRILLQTVPLLWRSANCAVVYGDRCFECACGVSACSISARIP